MVLKSKDWVERLNPDSKLPNFNTGRILVHKSQTVNESLQHTIASTDTESSKDIESEPQTLVPALKALHGAFPSSEAKPFPPCTHCGFDDHHPVDCRNYPEYEICRSYDHFTLGHNHVILVREGTLFESSQSSESSMGASCKTYGSNVHSTTDHNDFEHFKRGEKIQRHIKEPVWYLDSGYSRSMTGVKSYLQKYIEKPGLKVVFGDNSSCITEGYGSISCGGIVFSKVAFVNGLKYNLISISQLCDAKYIIQFDDKQGTIFNANKEIVFLAPRINDVYVLDMSSLTPNGACFFAKASGSVNWLWHKRLSHLNFKNINKLAKQKNVLGLPSLVYSKICLHLLYMDLFGPVSPMSVNHEKYTLVIVDEYSRNFELEIFCDEKGISQNISSPYTPKQNGVAEKKNRTVFEGA
ncbi:retrovirus-related pol polyprotein from transposon TNT 1-94 [Tanacetum coccineum]